MLNASLLIPILWSIINNTHIYIHIHIHKEKYYITPILKKRITFNVILTSYLIFHCYSSQNTSKVLSTGLGLGLCLGFRFLSSILLCENIIQSFIVTTVSKLYSSELKRYCTHFAQSHGQFLELEILPLSK